jgi:hypothetical protein
LPSVRGPGGRAAERGAPERPEAGSGASAGYHVNMPQSTEDRLAAAAEQARRAEERGDTWKALAAWKRYELIRDATRDPSALLADTVALSQRVKRLAGALTR